MVEGLSVHMECPDEECDGYIPVIAQNDVDVVGVGSEVTCDQCGKQYTVMGME